MKTFVPRLSDDDLEKIYQCIHQLLKQHITEDEYHELFLKDR
jgi:hypothetical protein